MILSLETATRAGSVALTRGPRVLALRRGEAQTSHSSHLLRHIEEILKEGGTDLRAVELFATASGPGSFTGLRIGVATAKAFAATLGRSCVGVSTLAAVAHAAGPSAHTLAMIPAGRGEVFAQLFSVDEGGAVTPLGEASHQPPERLLAGLLDRRQLRLAGEGAQQHEQLIRKRAEEAGLTLLKEAGAGNADAAWQGTDGWLLTRPVDALAIDIAALALRSYRSGEVYGPEQLQASYVRPSDAELKAQER